MDEEEKVIKFRYLDIDAEMAVWPVSHEVKDRALARLGIQRQPDETPLRAWVLAMCRENGLPEKVPAYEIGDAAMEHLDVRRFMWWLA